MRIKAIGALLLCVTAGLFAQVQTVLRVLVTVEQSGIYLVDDTMWTSAWSKSDSGGTFNGGRLFTNTNDGAVSSGQSRNLAVYEVTALDRTTGANTVALANGMSGYGTATASTYVGAGTSWKTGTPFFVNNTLYQPLCVADTANSFNCIKSALIVSPDYGAHWCNYTTYTGHSNTCASPFWSATGDAPSSNSDLQWPGVSIGSVTSMGRWGVVQVAQANAENIPASPSGLDFTTYMYLLTHGAVTGGYYAGWLHRLTLASDPMLPASWTHWNGSTWVADYTTLTTSVGNIGKAAGFNCQNAMWLPAQQKFVAFGGGNLSLVYQTSTDLINWTTVLSDYNTNLTVRSADCRVAGSCYGGFATPILATLTEDPVHGTQFWLTGDSTETFQKGYFQLISFNPSNARGGVQ